MGRRYKEIDGMKCESMTYTTTCSGCFNSLDGQPDGNYPWDDKAKCYKGSGCEECGYTGKRRMKMWVPIEGQYDPAEAQ